MPETVSLRVNGNTLSVTDGATVAAAIVTAGVISFRSSITGEPRGPLCGMGICFECRATIDGVAHRRTCQVLVRDGMEVMTDGRG
jgi:predicted molibdopterin-dependent oxidoreductase YjgC